MIEFYKWYYNTRSSQFENVDQWDFPIKFSGKYINMVSYIIDAHGVKSIDWSKFSNSSYKTELWTVDHKKTIPVEDLADAQHMIIKEALSV